MREIIFDTETTGFDPFKGDRIVEIGCVEMVDQILTGNSYHVYINPERDMPQGAFEVHGLSEEFLSDKPIFADIAADFLAFVGDDGVLVAHNAKFDMRFINYELQQIGEKAYDAERVIDTLEIAKRKHPMGPNSLDALCSRYNIDNSKREKHGALLDAELLADVYVELLGGKQRGLDFSNERQAEEKHIERLTDQKMSGRPKPLPSRLNEDQKAAHRAFVEVMGTKARWQQIWN